MIFIQYYSDGVCDINSIIPDNKQERIKAIMSDKNWGKCPPIDDMWKCAYYGKDLHKEYYICDVRGGKGNRLLYRLCENCSDKNLNG